MKKSSTKEKALKEGRALLQKHGYNGFSFQDIADHLGIKKPSLYDHYPSKEKLVLDILQNYSQQFEQWTFSIADKKPLEQIRKVFDVFYSFTSDHEKICPILALTTDIQKLSKNIKQAMRDFVNRWLLWLEKQIEAGQSQGEIQRGIDPKTLASFIYSQGMGSQFQARLKKDPSLALGSGDMIVNLIRMKK